MPTPERVREVRERLLTEEAVVARADGRRRELFPIAIGPKEGRALRDWVLREHALQTLETGLAFGISTLFICEGLLENGPGGRHVAIDPYEFIGSNRQTTHGGVGLEILADAGVRDLVEFYEEESQIVLPRLLSEGRRFDFAFLDGSHRFEGIFLDLIYSGRLLTEGAIVSLTIRSFPGSGARSTSALRILAGSSRTRARKAISTNGRS